MSGRPDISVEIVPASTGANAGLSGGFQLASCDGAPDVLNIDGVEDVTEERRSLVRHATRIFDLVRGDALPRAASRAFILGGGRAVEDRIDPRWRKSSYSGNGGANCVEVASGRPGVVAVRDSKNPDGPVLTVSRDEWARFISHLRDAG
jgi:hypothetical protein